MLQPSAIHPLPWRVHCAGTERIRVAVVVANDIEVSAITHIGRTGAVDAKATADFIVMVANASTDIVWEVDSERAAAQRRRPQPHLVGSAP